MEIKYVGAGDGICDEGHRDNARPTFGGISNEGYRGNVRPNNDG